MSGSAFRVVLGEQVFDITLYPGADGIQVEIGGERQPVSWRPRGEHAYTLAMGADSDEFLLLRGEAGWWVTAAGYQVEARVLDARAARLAEALPCPEAVSGRAEVRAPMPGRVASVRVAPGEAVERGALLATLEAMKMENELRAPHAGVVAEVAVAAGATVERGALLLVLGPLPDDTTPGATG